MSLTQMVMVVATLISPWYFFSSLVCSNWVEHFRFSHTTTNVCDRENNKHTQQINSVQRHTFYSLLQAKGVLFLVNDSDKLQCLAVKTNEYKNDNTNNSIIISNAQETVSTET